MRAGILVKHIIKSIITCTSFVFVAVCLAYAFAVYNAEVVHMGNDFSFVVKAYESVEVGTFETEQMGGAGYVLKLDGKNYVAVGVYHSVSGAENVQNALGDTYDVRTIHVNDLYFTTRKEKKNADMYRGAFSSLDGCIQVLSQEIARLEKGATQQSSKRILDILQKQFAYMKETYQSIYPTFSAVCANVEIDIQRETTDIVYAQKLRFILCELCMQYSQLARQFLP